LSYCRKHAVDERIQCRELTSVSDYESIQSRQWSVAVHHFVLLIGVVDIRTSRPPAPLSGHLLRCRLGVNKGDVDCGVLRRRHGPGLLTAQRATVVADAIAAARADSRQKDATERGAEEAVNDEVTRRVDDDEHVAQFGVVEVKASTLATGFVEQRVEDLVEQRRGLADDEHADDGDDTLGDVVILASLLSRCRRRHCGRPVSDGVQCADEFDVEVGQTAERQQIHDGIVENVTVDDLVDLVAAK